MRFFLSFCNGREEGLPTARTHGDHRLFRLFFCHASMSDTQLLLYARNNTDIFCVCWSTYRCVMWLVSCVRVAPVHYRPYSLVVATGCRAVFFLRPRTVLMILFIIRSCNTAYGQEVDVLQVEGRHSHLLFGDGNPSGSGCAIWKNLDRAD
jgi:hypothetical protein